MTRLARTVACLLVASSGVSAWLLARAPQRPPATRRNFVACPIVRDTATLPCWLAEHDGELYYLGTQGSSSSAFYPPQLLHDVLVEAELGEGPRVCGGIPLRQVRVSVLPEINRACNTIWPAEPEFTAPPSPPAPVPSYPDSAREFFVDYDFDSDYITLHTSRVILEAARIAKAVPSAKVEVHGPRASTLLSDGRVLTERASLAEARARKAADSLAGLGIDRSRLAVSWQATASPPDGVTDAARRRLSIRLR